MKRLHLVGDRPLSQEGPPRFSSNSVDLADAARRPLSECQLRALVENCEDAIATLDLDGTVTTWNAAAAELCGYSADEALGSSLASLVVPPELMHERDSLLAAVAAGTTVHRKARRRRRDGSKMLLSLRMAPVEDEWENVVGSVWVARDMTDRQARERSERRAASAHRWRTRIAEALAEGRLRFAAQPQVDLRERRVVRCELLMRMRIGERILGPADFLCHAEQSGQIVELDRWAIHEGIKLATQVPVAINISGASIADPRLIGSIREAFERHGADPERVTIEITETAATRDLETAARLIEQLCALGCGVALDDFGTGFGSLTYLHRLPVTEVKIDREFVGPDRASLDLRVVEAILAAARIFEMSTVAEGVEDAETLICLQELGVDLAQGFLLGRPTLIESTDDIAPLLRLPELTVPPRAGIGAANRPDQACVLPNQEDWHAHVRRLAAERCEEARRQRGRARAARDDSAQRRTEHAAIRAARA